MFVNICLFVSHRCLLYLFNIICCFLGCQYGACCNQHPTKWKGGQYLDEKALQVGTSPANLLLFRQHMISYWVKVNSYKTKASLLTGSQIGTQMYLVTGII